MTNDELLAVMDRLVARFVPSHEVLRARAAVAELIKERDALKVTVAALIENRSINKGFEVDSRPERWFDYQRSEKKVEALVNPPPANSTDKWGEDGK